MPVITELTAAELLKLHAAVLDELRGRGIVRSTNNPVGDLAEHLFRTAFGWDLLAKSAGGIDAVDAGGRRYQVKARRITPHNGSRQLGAIRNLPGGAFDDLAAVLFTPDYSVLRAALIPHGVVEARATFVAGTNSWKFLLTDAVWSVAGVRDVTARVSDAALGLHAARS